MNNDTFNATGLRTIVEAIEEFKYSKLNLIGDSLGQAATIVTSEDSNLASNCLALSNTMDECCNKFMDVVATLQYDIEEYIYQTTENEDTTSGDITNIDMNLDDVSNVINSIDF